MSSRIINRSACRVVDYIEESIVLNGRRFCRSLLDLLLRRFDDFRGFAVDAVRNLLRRCLRPCCNCGFDGCRRFGRGLNGRLCNRFYRINRLLCLRQCRLCNRLDGSDRGLNRRLHGIDRLLRHIGHGIYRCFYRIYDRRNRFLCSVFHFVANGRQRILNRFPAHAGWVDPIHRVVQRSRCNRSPIPSLTLVSICDCQGAVGRSGSSSEQVHHTPRGVVGYQGNRPLAP